MPIIDYVVRSAYIKDDKLSGKDIKIFDDKKKAIKHACKLMILCGAKKVYEVQKEKSRNGLIYDSEVIFTTDTDFSSLDPARHT